MLVSAVSSGMVMRTTIAILGLPTDLIKTHLLQKGTNVSSQKEQLAMEELIRTSLPAKSEEATTERQQVRVIVMDQGSRPGPPLVRSTAVDADVRTLIIDHHMSDAWPDEAQVLTACHSPPISTSSLLTYLACRPLHPDIPKATGWYAILGVFGDLGPNEIAWGDTRGSWPVCEELIELGEICKAIGKKPLTSAVSALNARGLDLFSRTWSLS